MSAYMVSDEHIDILMSFAVAKKLSYYTEKKGHTYVTRQNAEEIGRILIDENARSIGERYGPNADMGEKTAAQEYKFKLSLTVKPAIQVLKACNCFDYQACESDDYETTLAAKIIDSIRDTAIRALPGYDDSPGWDDWDRKGRKAA